MNFFHSLTLYTDLLQSLAIYIQNNASLQMEALIQLHDNIIFYLAIILFGISWMMISIIIITLLIHLSSNIISNTIKHDINYIVDQNIRNEGIIINLEFNVEGGVPLSWDTTAATINGQNAYQFLCTPIGSRGFQMNNGFLKRRHFVSSYDGRVISLNTRAMAEHSVTIYCRGQILHPMPNVQANMLGFSKFLLPR